MTRSIVSSGRQKACAEVLESSERTTEETKNRPTTPDLGRLSMTPKGAPSPRKRIIVSCSAHRQHRWSFFTTVQALLV
jgi:hypothetical protein